jgi:hypothetical protein
LLFPSVISISLAECGIDHDWPERPCYDSGTPTEDELRKEWSRYYDYKGKEWMESKKAEMDRAIGNGVLKEWILTQSEPDNYANYNVYYYYHLNGQAPSVGLIPTSDENAVSTHWETSALGWAAVIGAALATTAVIAIVFGKARHRTSLQ